MVLYQSLCEVQTARPSVQDWRSFISSFSSGDSELCNKDTVTTPAVFALHQNIYLCLCFVCGVYVSVSFALHALDRAVQAGSVSMVQRALQAKQGLSAAVVTKALRDAIEERHQDVALVLLGNELVDLNEKAGRELLHHAVRASMPQVVSALVDRGADIDALEWLDKSTALHRAASLGDKETAAILLEAGADIDATKGSSSYTALNRALADKKLDMYWWLLDRGASIEASNLDHLVSYALRWESGDLGDNDILASLLQIEEVSKDSESLLKLAVQWDRVKLFQAMLEKLGIGINDYNAQGRTLLHRAVSSKSYNIAEFLLTQGAEVNAKTRSDKKPEHWQIDMDGATALHLAAKKFKGLEMADLLLEHGADIHATDGQGRTPLHWVTAFSNFPDRDMFAYLIENGANYGTADNNGKKPTSLPGNQILRSLTGLDEMPSRELEDIAHAAASY